MNRTNTRNTSRTLQNAVSPARKFRNKALAGAIATALSFGAAGSAAADSLYAFDGTQVLTLQNYLQMIGSTQTLSAPVTTSVTGSEMGYRGVGGDGVLSVDSNTFQALTLSAGGLLGANGADNAIDLGLLGVQDDGLPVGDANQGIGIFNGQFATTTATATLTGDNIGLDVEDHASGSATVGDNRLAASALANGASNRATGSLNTTPFSSTTAGAVGVGYVPGAADVSAVGGVTIGNAQVATSSVSSATVLDSTIAYTNSGASAGAAVDVSGNATTAIAAGNQGDNRFAATAGAPSYAGSVGVVNGQVNIDGATSALISNADIGASLEDAAYTGGVNVSGNRLEASAQGNDAAAVSAGGGVARGNAISFGQGIAVSGVDEGANLALSIGNVDNVAGSASADLSLLNTQGNQVGSVDSTITGSRIGATLAGFGAGGGATATDNQVAASAGGNSAINLVSTDGAMFDASVAAGNQQANDRVNIFATATGIEVGVSRAAAGTVGDVTVGDSGISAAANGNRAQTVVSVQAADVDASGTPFRAGVLSTATSLGLDHSNVNYGDPGILVGTLQGNYGEDTNVSSTVAVSRVGASFDGSVTGSNVSVDNGAIAATAGGNDASTSVSVTGATGELKAALGNGQYNESNVDATSTLNFVGATGADFADSGVTVGDSSLEASANANRASNTLSADFDSSLSLASSINANGSVIAAGSGTNNAQAGLNLLNTQSGIGDVTATLASGQVGIVGADANDVSAAVQGNRATVNATGNSVGNTLTVTAGSLEHGGNGDLANIGNLQRMDGDVNAAMAGVGIGYEFSGDSIGGNGAVDGNTISAFAGGNMAGGDGGAGNRLSVSGASLVEGGAAFVDGTSNMAISGLSALASFTLQNVQAASGERNATVASASIGGANGGDASDFGQSVTDNGISADARDNYAANTLGLAFDSSLTTTGMLQSAQTSGDGDVQGTVSGAQIGLTAAGAVNGTWTVSGNGVSAKAVANTASNQLSAEASDLSGNAGDGFLGSLGVPAGYRGAVVNGGSGTLVVVADYGLSNAQNKQSDTDVLATAAGIQVGMSTDSDDFVGEGSATVTGNTLGALAQSNSAGNTLALSGSSIDATAAVVSRQLSLRGDVQATATDVHINVNAAAGIVGDLPMTVADNAVTVSAGLNDAGNTLRVDADNAIAGSVGVAGASNDDIRFDGLTGATADFAVANIQHATSDATAELSDVRAGVVAGAGISGFGAVTVTGNLFDAKATANTAGNAVVMNGAGSVDATAAVFNQQRSYGAIGTTVDGVDVAAGNRDTGTGDLAGPALTVADNRITGAASGNSVSNAIDVGASALNAAAVRTESSIGDASSAIANYALNSVQSNEGAITSTMTDISIGTNVNGGAGSVLNSASVIGGNMVAATAMANSASNSIQLTSAIGMPSAALTNSQVNMASVSATVTGARIGIATTAGGPSSVTVSNNTISATATGNSAINHIGLD